MLKYFKIDKNDDVLHKESGTCVLKGDECETYIFPQGYLLARTKGAKRFNRLYAPNGELVYKTGADDIEVVVTTTSYGIRKVKDGEDFLPMLVSLKENLDDFKFYALPYQEIGTCFVIHDEDKNLFYLCQKKSNQIIAQGSAREFFKKGEEAYIALKDEKTNLWTLYNHNGKVEPELTNVKGIYLGKNGFMLENKVPVMTRSDKSNKFWDTFDRYEGLINAGITTLIILGALCYYGCTEKKQEKSAEPKLIEKASPQVEKKAYVRAYE